MTGYVVGEMLTISMFDDGNNDDVVVAAVSCLDYTYCFIVITFIAVFCTSLELLDVVVDAVNLVLVGDAVIFMSVVATVIYTGMFGLSASFVDNVDYCA